MDRLLRLTKWDPAHGWQENHDNDTRKWKNGCRACMEKLAAYEDTGLTPEQINILLKMAQWIVRDSQPWEGDKQICNVAHLRRLLKGVSHG